MINFHKIDYAMFLKPRKDQIFSEEMENGISDSAAINL